MRMNRVSGELLNRNVALQMDLWMAAKRYMDFQDERWMFAFAHFRITQLINDTLEKSPWLFRDPDQLIRFNISFATAFLAAVAEKTTPPWKKAFSQCARAGASEQI